MGLMKFFALDCPKDAPRGDYGDILLQGLGEWGPNRDVEVERVGPYVPPTSFPGPHVVVTPRVRRALQAAFPTLAFAPVHLRKAVWFRWRGWRRVFWRYPASGSEPEDYILPEAHSDRAAKTIGTLWAFDVPVIADIAITTKDWRDSRGDRGAIMAALKSDEIDRSRWSGQVCFRSTDSGRTYVVEPLADWLRHRYGRHLDVREVPSLNA